MRNGDKRVDAVRLMRRIRDRLSARFRRMSATEQQQYIQEELKRVGVSEKLARQRRRRSA